MEVDSETSATAAETQREESLDHKVGHGKVSEGSNGATVSDAAEQSETKEAGEKVAVEGVAKSQETATADGDDDEEMEEAEEPDEEEELLTRLETEKEEPSAKKPRTEDSETQAPILLQASMKSDKGRTDSRNSSSTTQGATTSDAKMVSGEEKKVDDTDQSEATVKGNQLDFLLSKASEYSNFIAADLKELQNGMAKEAQMKLDAADKKGGKKRKSGKGESNSSKRSKRSNSESALRSAQDKHSSLNVGSRPIFIQPPNLADGCKLKDYQLEGVRWLTSLYENGVSGILADEMGLGKTIQVIAMIAHLRTMSVPGPFLIVAPLATLPNWVREFGKWLPELPVVRYHGTGSEREAMIKGKLHPRHKRQPDFPAIVTSYEVAIKDHSKLNKIGEFTMLVVDEGQRLKNFRCTLIRSLKRIAASNRLLLSGTPIQNNLEELWSLLNFVNPSIFDDLSVFQSWFGFKDIGQKDRGGTDEESIIVEQRRNKTVTKLHEILRPFLLRRIKADVLTDMPPKREVVVYAGLSKLQLGYANFIDKGTLREVLLNQGMESARGLSQINKQMNHRKNANHPFLFGEPLDAATGQPIGTTHPQLLVRASGKFALLDRMLERLFRDKHQVLIFSQMTALLNVIEDYLVYRNWKYCRIDGSTKIDDRQRQMDVFNAEKTGGENGSRNERDDRYFVFLLSTRAGGLGINLTGSDTVIIFDSDWTPQMDRQAMDRCHRIGQTRPVAVYRLLTVNSVDIEMMEKQISKKKLERMAITGGDFRRAGSRSRGDFSSSTLTKLLTDDIKDLHAKGGEVENVKVDEEEFDAIMDRDQLFAEGQGAIPKEGKMYDILDDKEGDMLGAMNA